MTAALPTLRLGDRLARVRHHLDEAGLDALVVTDAHDIRWCTGFTGSHGVLVVGPGEAWLLTDSRYATQAPEELERAGCDIGVRITSAIVADGTGFLGDAARVGFDADRVSWADQQRWAAALVGEPVAADAPISILRSVKDEAELARMQRAAAIVDAALADVREMLVPGTSERQLARRLDDAMRDRGATGPAYETIVASGPNAALPHSRPGERRFEPGDLVVIDAGSVVEGYRSDMTRTFAVGEPDDTAVTIHEVVTRAQAAGVDAVRPGVEAGAIDAVCRDLITAAGYGERFGHGTGHGVGLDIHELPAVRAGNAAILQPGHVITVEPGIYLPGIGGVRVEDMVVVTDEGCRPLTRHPKIPLQ